MVMVSSVIDGRRGINGSSGSGGCSSVQISSACSRSILDNGGLNIRNFVSR